MSRRAWLEAEGGTPGENGGQRGELGKAAEFCEDRKVWSRHQRGWGEAGGHSRVMGAAPLWAEAAQTNEHGSRHL